MTVHYIEMASWKVDAILICSVLTLFIGIVLMIYLAVIVRASKLPVWPSFKVSEPVTPTTEKKKPGRPKKAAIEQLKQDPIVQAATSIKGRKLPKLQMKDFRKPPKHEEWEDELSIKKED